MKKLLPLIVFSGFCVSASADVTLNFNATWPTVALLETCTPVEVDQGRPVSSTQKLAQSFTFPEGKQVERMYVTYNGGVANQPFSVAIYSVDDVWAGSPTVDDSGFILSNLGSGQSALIWSKAFVTPAMTGTGSGQINNAAGTTASVLEIALTGEDSPYLPPRPSGGGYAVVISSTSSLAFNLRMDSTASTQFSEGEASGSLGTTSPRTFGVALTGSAAPIVYSTSWFGNSVARASDTQPAWIQAFVDDLFVVPEGTVYTNSRFDEAGTPAGIYQNGAKVGALPGMHFQTTSITPVVTANSSYVFASVNAGVRRFLRSNHTQSGSDLALTNVTGLAADAGTLYVSDAGSGLIRRYNASTMAALSSWTLARPGQLAVDAGGKLWAIQNKDASNPARVVRLNSTGQVEATVTFATTVVPADIAFSTSGLLHVADKGTESDIKVYNPASLSGSPTTVASRIGQLGGALGGTATQKGMMGTRRFFEPKAVGLDSNGNVYVGNDGHRSNMAIEAFNSSGSPLWRVFSYEFEDLPDFDPLSNFSKAYTRDAVYHADFSNTAPGSEMTLQAITLNPYAYPEDPRVNGVASGGAFVRRINGQLFLIAVDQYSKYLQFFRFASQTDGYVAIPSVMFFKRLQQTDTYPPNIPTTPSFASGLWRDTNGNARFESGEYEVSTGDNVYGYGWWVDDAGGVWKALRENGIRYFPVASQLDAVGNPVYSRTTSSLTANPAPFFTAATGHTGDLRRVVYDASQDTLYLSGFNQASGPYSGDDRGAGRILAKYANWAQGNRSPSWSIQLPYQKDEISPEAFCVAGDYLFMGFFRWGKPTVVKIYALSDGSWVGDLTPGPEIGGVCGDLDIPNGIRAYQLPDGEYVVLHTDHRYARGVMFRFRDGSPTSGPLWASRDIGNVTPPGSLQRNGSLFTVNGSGADIFGSADAFHFVSRPMTGDGTITARVVSQQNTHSWAKAGVMIREGTAAGAKHAFLAVTPASGVSFQRRLTTDGSSVSSTVTGVTAPQWVRLVRAGSQFTAYRSADGVTWTQVGPTETVAMGSVVEAGLAVTSHKNGTLCEVVFDDVTP